MWSVFAIILWVVYDVFAVIVTAGKIPILEWWLLLGGGIALVLLTAVSALLEYWAQNTLSSEVGSLKRQLAEAQANPTGRTDILALLGGETFRQLQMNTQTADKPVESVIKAANKEIAALRARIEARERREWQLLSEDQENELMRCVRRSGLEEVGQQRVSIMCSEFPDSFYLAEQLAATFRKAGWEHPKNPPPEQIWADIDPGIAVCAPVGHADADLIFRTLSELLGSNLVRREMIESVLPTYFDRAFVVQIQIGRKPTRIGL